MQTRLSTVEDYRDEHAIMSHVFKGKDDHDCLIEVVQDYDGWDSPRQWSNLWTWVTTSRAGYSDKKDDTRHYTCGEFEDDSGKLDKQFCKENLIVHLYLYRHSGDVISAGGFPAGSPCNCPWDSGCMGFAFVSKDKVRQEFNVKRISKKVLGKARECLEGEVKAMNMFTSGQVYGFRVIDMDTDVTDSIWGNYCDSMQEIREFARGMLKGFTKDGEEAAVAEALVA